MRNAATKVTATVVKWVYGVDHQLEQAVSKVGPGVQHVDPAVRGPGKEKKPVCWPISADQKIKKATKEPKKSSQKTYILTESRDFLPLFYVQKTLPGTHINRLKRFREIFRFREDIQL